VKIRLRYNKDRKGIEDAWRIFAGDVEHNVRDFIITVRCESNTTFERGEMKWNVTCEGKLEIVEGRAFIYADQ
jgi:hypothetical protein